ncbi:hypothetical protein [Micromonospora carbonacea]|uniref:hypothetical protein n=1 Tax=Micromonospora carbonacea TaxID=47853 RepID=UPI003716AB2F
MPNTDIDQVSVERNGWDYLALLATTAWLVVTAVGVYITFTTDSPWQFLTHAVSVPLIVLWMVARAQSRKRNRA